MPDGAGRGRPKVRNDSRLEAEMAAAGLDAVVAFSMENVFYLSGALFTLQDNLRDRLAAAGVARGGRDFLVCATNELSAVEPDAHVFERRGYVEFRSTALKELAGLLADWGLDRSTIGLEKRYLMAEFYEELQALLPHARLVGGDRVIETARAIKTPEHIAIIRRNSHRTEEAVLRTLAETRAGETEKRMAIRLIDNMYDLGADAIRHVVLTVGDNAVHAHPYPSASKRLDAGDIIRIDVGGLFAGHGTDIARMGIVGEPSPAQREIYARLRACQRETALKLVPGARACDVYQAAVDAYARRGIAYQRDHVGHSISILGGHDNPMLHPNNPQALEQGMVMCLEPIFRDDAGRRYTVEDTFLVAAGGGELLTTVADTSEMYRVR
jgi:Xaa-Pro dipeptidase